MSNLTNQLFKITVGISILLFSISALIISSNYASAENQIHSPSMFMSEDGASGGGKYSLQYELFQDQAGNISWHMIIFNKSNGAYKSYSWENGGWADLFPNQKPFPSLP